MASITAGQTGTFTLDAFGYIDVVAAGDGTLNAVSRAPNLKSNVSISKLASVRYGPYGVPMDFTIACTNGTITYTTTAGYAASGLAMSSGAGASKIRTDAPFAGVIYDENSQPLSNAYTWELKPTAAAGNVGAIIWITTANAGALPVFQEFVCCTYDGGSSYFWRPLSKIMSWFNGTDSSTISSSAVESAALFTDTIPGGLVQIGCEVESLVVWNFAGVTAGWTKNYRHKLAGSNYLSITAANNALVARIRTQLDIEALSGAGSTTGVAFSNGADSVATQSTAAELSLAIDWTADVALTYTIQLGVADPALTAKIVRRRIKIVFP